MAEELSVRRRAASAARALLAMSTADQREIIIATLAFVGDFSGSKDPLVSELVDLVEHEPKRGGFLGVSESDWLDHRYRVLAILLELEE